MILAQLGLWLAAFVVSMHAQLNPDCTLSANEFLLPTYYAPPTTSHYQNIQPTFTNILSITELENTAVSYLQSQFKFGPGISFAKKSCFQDSQSQQYHYYAVQTINSVEIANMVASLVLDPYGNVRTMHSNWFDIPPQEMQSLNNPSTSLSLNEAVASLSVMLGGNVDPSALGTPNKIPNMNRFTYNHIPTVSNGNVACSEKYYKTRDGIYATWVINMPLGPSWINAYVDKTTGKVLGASDYSSKLSSATRNGCEPPGYHIFTKVNYDDNWNPTPILAKRNIRRLKKRTLIPNTVYTVVPLGGKNPLQTPPTLVYNPENIISSPFGWHDPSNGEGSVPSTRGNNVVSRFQISEDNDTLTTVHSQSFYFTDQPDLTQDPSTYIKSVAVNAFYLANMFHDILYLYGFNEEAGNYQVSNRGLKGNEADPVIISVMDGDEENNAYFNSPSDGKPGILRLFVFTGITPNRHSGYDNSVVLHELTHGVSERLTGGPENSNCLQQLESNGMGEGWSDAIAIALEMKETDTSADDKILGAYVKPKTRYGFRKYPYSTNTKLNPLVYSSINGVNQTHYVGTVWGTILFEVYWSLVNQYGFEPDWTKVTSTKGNVVFLQLMVDGMKIQGCNPTFLSARSAILTAEKFRYNGVYRCSLLRGFARRGLGLDARMIAENSTYIDGTLIDNNCQIPT
ncbi:hypothetical protein RTP6_004436 [Batrachochytrium dendrobatidis]